MCENQIIKKLNNKLLETEHKLTTKFDNVSRLKRELDNLKHTEPNLNAK